MSLLRLACLVTEFVPVFMLINDNDGMAHYRHLSREYISASALLKLFIIVKDSIRWSKKVSDY